MKLTPRALRLLVLLRGLQPGSRTTPSGHRVILANAEQEAQLEACSPCSSQYTLALPFLRNI